MTAPPHDYAVRGSREIFRGRVIAVRSDEVTMPGGEVATRDWVEHPGAVGVVALDEAHRVLLVRQYRHPVRRRLWELPAGLLDVDGEPPVDCARRELYEEAHLRGARWDVLADTLTTPGMSDEAIRVYLARDLTSVASDERHAGTGEEAELELAWVEIDEAVHRVLAGEIENAMCVVGVLAAARAADAGFTGLRPADAPWPARGR